MKGTKRVDLKSLYHTQKKNCNYVQWQMLTRLMVVNILQLRQISSHNVVHLKLTYCYMSIMLQKILWSYILQWCHVTENSIETCILPYVKQIASPDLVHETGCSGLVHWDDPEEWDGEGGGRGSGWGTHVHPWLIHVNVWLKALQYCN